MIESVKIKQAVEEVEQVFEKKATEVQEPSDRDLAKFEQAMGEEHIDASRSNAALSVKPGAHELSPGDAILQSFEKLRTGHNEKLEHISSTLETMSHKQEMNPEDMLKLQWELFQTTFQLEVTTKVVDKSDQGVTTLLRSQG